jgi:hypothetical protein
MNHHGAFVMNILRISRGFTTNSSGSYEWLAGISPSSTTTTIPVSPSSGTSANFNPLVVIPKVTQAKPMSAGDIGLLVASVLAGLLAALLMFKDSRKKKK